MSTEASFGLNDPLDIVREIAEDPLIPSDITLYAAHLVARTVVDREADKGFSKEQIHATRELAASHPELLGLSGAVGFNQLLEKQAALASVRKVQVVDLPVEDSLSEERILNPSSPSIWISRQKWLPFRSSLANLMEDVKLAAIAPIFLAGSIARNDGREAGIAVATSEIGMPVFMGIMVTSLPTLLQTGENPLIISGILTTTLSYLAFGRYLLSTNPNSRSIISEHRQILNNP